ncbi:hypothetical protein Pmar_PMAR014884, partial [Perkinsus marinus ATCC 50983]
HLLHSSYKSIILQQRTVIAELLTCGPLIFEYIGNDAGNDAGNGDGDGDTGP